jgi:hypothetical protein
MTASFSIGFSEHVEYTSVPIQKKFSKVSALVHLLHTVTRESTFENNVCAARRQ